MTHEVRYLPEAKKDLDRLDTSIRKRVLKAIDKVKTNPLPNYEGGYGKPLANQNGLNLHGLLKIKLKSDGIRIVYKLIRLERQMLVIIIGARADSKVYKEAQKRAKELALN